MMDIKSCTYLFLLMLLLGYACTLDKDEINTKKAEVEIPDLPSLEGKQILMVYGGWDGHQPLAYTEKISKLLADRGADVTLADTVNIYVDSVLMASMDLIIQSITMDKVSAEQMEGLLQAVKNGAGFAGAHGGFGDAFRENTQYQYMTGAQFVAHPGGQVEYTVNIKNSNHQITAGISDFETQTEQYYMHVDPNVNVLATTTFDGEHDAWIEGAVMPVAYTKYFGKGRIFYVSLGHRPEEFDDGPAQDLLMNGLRWASGSKYLDPED